MKDEFKLRNFVAFLMAFLMVFTMPMNKVFADTTSTPAAPVDLQVLSGSVTDTGFTLVWHKPDNYSDITDYKITVSDSVYEQVYYASENQTVASPYIKQFYDNNVGDLKDDSGNTVMSAYKISMHSFVLTGLKPDTLYTIQVQSVDANGNVSAPVTITQSTAPSIPSENIINIESTGAVGNGVLADDVNGIPSSGTLNTAAIQKAIDECPDSGVVLVPAGKIFVTGPIHLKSNITLDVEGTLLGTTDPDQYPNPYDTDPTQVGQKSAPLISTVSTDVYGNTIQYQNIRIVGHGVINGNGWAQVSSKDTSVPIDDQFDQYQKGNSSNISTTAKNHLALNQFNKYLQQGTSNAYATRSNLMVFNNVTNLYIGDGLTVTNPSFHTISVANSKNVVLNQLITSTYDCNNGDGINFGNSTGLTVVNSVFNTGDDSVNFDAGVGLSGEQNPPTGDAWVFDNYFGRGHGVIAMGSHTAAWIQNILAEDNVINGTAVGLRGKSQSGNGGGARNIVFRDSALANVTDNDGSPFLLTDGYSSALPTDTSNWAPDEPTFHDIKVQNCTVNGSKKYAILIQGAPDGFDYNITFDNVAFGAGTYQTKISYLKNSTFKDVVFYGSTPNYDGDKTTPVNPWFFVHSSGLQFLGTTTQPSIPEWPSDNTATVSNVTYNSASIKWSNAVSGTFTGYQLIGNDGVILAKVDANTTSYDLTGLTPDTNYTITVEATDDQNNTIFGPMVTFTTAKGSSSDNGRGTETIDYNKIDVWDFGAEQLDPAKYNNKITVDIINSLYPGVTPGTSGVNINGFTLNNGEFLFNDGGKLNTHRLRTINTQLTRYDQKSLKSSDGSTTYTGYLYSNSSGNPNVYLGVYLYKDDIVTLVVASNGNPSTIAFESPSGKVSTQVHTLGSSTASVMTFYASEEGLYKIYSKDEKLVVARVYRQHTRPVTVSGTVTAPSGLTNYGITFTNRQTGEVTTADVVDGKYSATLNENYDYDVSLFNANGYIITGPKSLSIANGAGDQTFNVNIEAVSLVTISGHIIGLPSDELAKLKLNFSSSTTYMPEINISNDGSYTVQLESGVTYTIDAEGVNDYTLNENTISAKSDETHDFVFTAKPTYQVTLNISGIDDTIKNNAVITFTNVNEVGYSYSFNLTDNNIKLRNGQYKITISGIGEYPVVLAPTPDLKIKDAPATANLDFKSMTKWDFAIYNSISSGPGIETINGSKYYLGLKLSNSGVSENNYYLLLSKGGTIDVPVKLGDIVLVSYTSSAAFTFDNNDATKVDVDLGSTNQIKTATYVAPSEGYVTISGIEGNNSTQTYLTSIRVYTPVPYRETITVGSTGRDYTTINDALDAIRAMNRPNNERVTVEIDPGNYEEMLVVDVPNVTFKNASANPSTNLTDKGIDIDKNAVRITSYYGTGYSYYSMGPDGKYHADLLAVNKANGYLSYHNPGAGTTNGSFWNATVVIYADGFEADGIIFENSFNQYISDKEANDIVVPEAGNKGIRPTTFGDTSVQNKSYVERAAALAIADNAKEIYFNNCRFVGRQDTLYGGNGAIAAFNKSAIMGSTDYIFGPMTAVFYKSQLVMNTSDASNDVAYITAAQQSSGRGFLMYNCTITSTTPGVDTASTKHSKPGYFGRPWLANTSEVVFDKTIIEPTDYYGDLQSLIQPAGWLSTLGGTSPKIYEYDTMESLAGVNNSSQRVSWSTVLRDGKLLDGTDISTADKAITAFLGDWRPFEIDAQDDVAVIVNPGNNNGNTGNTSSGTGNTRSTSGNSSSANNAIGTVNKNGNVITWTLDVQKAKDLINNTKDKNVVFDLTTLGTSQQKVVEISKEILTASAASDKDIVIKSDNASIVLSKDTLDTGQIATGVNISIKDNGKPNASNYVPLSNAIDISIKSDSGNVALTKPVEVTLNISKADDPRKVAVYYYNPTTNQCEYVGGKIDKKGDTITFNATHFSQYAALEYDKTFDDIKDNWAKDDIEVLASRHIVEGMTDTQYEPSKTVTRAEFTAMILRLLNIKEEAYSGEFSDVKSGDWYANTIEAAYKAGIIEGDGKNMRPNDSITREEMTAIAMRAYEMLTSYKEENIGATSFNDDKSISDWAKNVVANATKLGIVNGEPNNVFAPKGIATRAEAAAIIYGLLEKSGNI
ncbi:pectinesterase family protein [Thermoanaerobacterium thermosaccharolyticum]|uniref:pectinesterase family protein n=1 Tax=Thermoanaerobacterium thermosaccharolyticum TaxID=1517 RepID=UPI003DA931FC